MRLTKIMRLDRLSELADFCKVMLDLKSRSPASLRITIAITVEQDAEVRNPVGTTATGQSHVEAALQKLDGSPATPTSKPKPPPAKPAKRKPKFPKRKRRALPASTVVEL